MLKYIKGDIINLIEQQACDIVVHGCNCFHTMGAGIAKSLKDKFPGVYQADLQTVFGDEYKLGTYSRYQHGSVLILNMYTQYSTYSPYGPPVSYIAIEKGFAAMDAEFKDKAVMIPKIGAGLAGGDWDKIAKIISKCSNNTITVVEYDK